MAEVKPDCNCHKFLEIMGMSWHECMYGVMIKRALELASELQQAQAELKSLKEKYA